MSETSNVTTVASLGLSYSSKLHIFEIAIFPTRRPKQAATEGASFAEVAR